MNGKQFLNLVKRSLVLTVSAGMLIALPAAAKDRYTDPAGVNKRIEQLTQSSNGFVTVQKLAVSPGGIELVMMEISSNRERSNPAVLVVGNLSGVNPLSTEAALSLAEKISKDSKLCSDVTWFILPMGNPDAYSRYFSKPLYMDTGNATRYNDDNDDQADEDGFNDLDGNGVITQMRLKSPDGIWIPVTGDPRLMRKADPLRGEKGIYKLYTEGIDDDGDGQYNEDTPGGTNVNINFPHLFKDFDRRSGYYAGSAAESYALMKFAFEHPEISMVFAFGSTNFLLVPPQGGRKGSVDFDRITVPEDVAKAFGFESRRTYSMAEIMEAVKPMLPPGMEVDEGMIANFLGLGAVVNPLPDDMAFYNKISEEYKEYLKGKGVKDERFDPAPPEDGSFELWAYYHLGVPVFSMDLWALPKVKEEKKEASGLTTEALEKMSSDEFIALGEEKINAFLKEKGAPSQFNAKMLMERVRGGQVTPAQMAGMMKQMPAAPKDEQKGDQKEIAHLAFSDKIMDGKGFINWKGYSHPTLGEVEIGGFVPFSDNTPPVTITDSLMDLHLPWVFELVKKLPKLKITQTKVTDKGSNVYQVEAWVTNDGFLPFPSAMGKRNRIPAPAILIIDGSDAEILSGKKRTTVGDLGGYKSAKYTWLVRKTKKGVIVLKLESKQAGTDTKTINIEG